MPGVLIICRFGEKKRKDKGASGRLTLYNNYRRIERVLHQTSKASSSLSPRHLFFVAVQEKDPSTTTTTINRSIMHSQPGGQLA